ncbi:hypothetical protein EI77_00857 [Prosthecobacter fusiformis]|uniref:Uncharacterized protein n=1 Tax=Prosthecobacter fusiformis TaxID=48464 RepID=A0A4R7STE5_9BACT|nr:hypothetical protein EI77_00857 [Prosthecobacter fusiformis]
MVSPAAEAADWETNVGGSSKPDPRAWMSTIGMFSGDELMKEIDAEGARLRREQTKHELSGM